MIGGPLGPLMMKVMGSKVGKPMIHKFFMDFMGTAIEKKVTNSHWLPLHEGGTWAFLAFARELKFMMSQFSRYSDAFKRIDVPATIILGAKDPVFRHEKIISRFAADLGVKPKDVHIIDGANHFLQEDRPLEITGHIATFVSLDRNGFQRFSQ